MKEYVDEGGELLEIETAHLIEKLYDYTKNESDGKLLHFFKGVIPQSDLEALESALFLRHAFQKRESIEFRTKLKLDIHFAFGERGKNIANLCTAGYFDHFLIPLYNGSPRIEFDKIYESLVNHSFLAVFVSHKTSIEEIRQSIITKMQLSKKYGLNFLHIHGIGHANSVKIKECISQLDSGTIQKRHYEKEGILVIELRF